MAEWLKVVTGAYRRTGVGAAELTDEAPAPLLRAYRRNPIKGSKGAKLRRWRNAPPEG